MLAKKSRRNRIELRSPYPGIRPFRRDEARIFFGRDEQIEALLALLERSRFLAVVGTSGSGKSSLVKAGLIPKLEAGELGEAGSTWYIADLRPGNTPLLNLAREILRSGILGDDWPNDERNFDVSLGLLLPRLRVGPKGLVEVLRAAGIPPFTNLLIVADQFEEIIRFYNEQTANDALKFVNLLMATAADRSVPAHVVMTMRSDFLGDCALFPQLPERLNDTQFLCPRLSRDQMREAILLPARSFGGDVEEALASELLSDVGVNSDQLPLIQHCLARMWGSAGQAGGRRLLTLAQYRGEAGAGNVRPVFAAMSNHADEILDRFSEPESRRLVECAFRALATRGPAGQVVRRSVSLRQLAEESSLTTAPEEIARVQAQLVRIVDAFRADGHNFLMPSVLEKPELEPDTMIDVSHESLLRQWQKLTGWLQVEAKLTAELRNLVHEANRWKEKKEKQLLLSDLRLAQMLQWRAQLPSTHWPLRYVAKEEFELAQEFLDASALNQKEKDEAEQRRLQAEREEEIERRTQRDRAKRLRAEEKSRRARQLRNFVIAGGVIALAFTAWAIWEREMAEDERQAAIKAKDVAVIAQNNAIAAEEKAARLADSQTQMADAFRMLAQSRESQDSAPLRSTLISLEALRLAQRIKDVRLTADAGDAFRAALSKIGGIGLYANQGQIESIAVHESSRGVLHWVAASGADGSLVLWDLRAGAENGKAMPITFGYESPVRSLRITNDGRWLIAKSGVDLHTIWKLGDAAPQPHVIKGYSDHYFGVTNEKSYLLLHQEYHRLPRAPVVNPDGVPLIDLSQDDPLARPIRLEDSPSSQNNSFSKDGKWLALMTTNATASLYDLTQAKPGELLKRLTCKGPDNAKAIHSKSFTARNGEFTDDASRLIAYLSDGTIRIWHRQGSSWNPVAEDIPLPGVDASQRNTVKTDSRGLCAFVAVQPAKTDDPTKEATGLFFDASKLQQPIKLGAVDPASLAGPEIERYVEVDEMKAWLAFRYKGKMDGAIQFDGIRIWNLKTPKAATPIFLEVREGLADFKLTRDGHWLIARSFDNTVRLWDLESLSKGNHRPIVLRGHDGQVSTFALQQVPFGALPSSWLVTGGSDGSLRLWDLNALTTSAGRTTYRAPAIARYSELSANNATFVQSGENGAARIWNLAAGSAAGRPDHVIKTNDASYPSLALSHDGRWLMTYQTGADARADLWDLATGAKPQRRRQLNGIKGAIFELQVTDDGKWIVVKAAANRAAGELILYGDLTSMDNKQPVDLLQLPGLPEASAFLGLVNSKPICLVEDRDTITIQPFNQTGGKTIADAKQDGNLIFFETSRAAHRLVVKNERAAFVVYKIGWDASKQKTATDRQELRIKGDASVYNVWFNSIRFHHIGDRWAIIEAKDDGDQNKLFVWNLNSSDAAIVARTVDVLPSRISPLFRWSTDGRWLLVNPAGPGELWDLNSEPKEGLPESRTPLGHFEFSTFSLDGSRLITAGVGKINVWKLLTGSKPELEREIADDASRMVEYAAASRSGNRLVVSGRGAPARVWDLQVKNPIPLSLSVRESVNPHVFLNHDGSYLTFIDESLNLLSSCALTEGALEATAETTIGRNLSKKEWADLGISQEYQRTFAGLAVPIQRIAPSPTLRMSERREKPGKARDSRTLIDNNYMLTKDDPIDKVQKGAFKGIPVPFKEGHYYIIDMTSKYDDKKNKILDPFLRLEDPDGKQVASDDDSGGNLDAQITYFCDRSGPFTVIATTYDRKTGPFHLTVRELPRIPEEDKLVVEQGIAHKNGELTWDDYEVRNVPCKVYALRLDKGQLCQIDMASNDFDALLRFENATGKELYVNDNGGGGANARIVFNCEESGNYRVVATSTVARTGAFELIVQTR